MDPFTALKLAELRQHDLAVDAARARLAADARRARRHRTHIDGRGRIARRWQRLRTATTRPAPATPTARPIPFDDLAAKLASNGPADAQRTALTEPESSDAALLLEGIVLRLQADLRWLEACEQNWTGRRSRS